MSKWMLLLGAFAVWAAHFFLLYGFASVFPETQLARLLTLVATVPALAANAVLLWLAAARKLSAAADELDRWVFDLAAIGAGLSLVAVVWQAMPAVIV
jgi:hypothetical protein